jgi:hypothetical protein
MDTKGVVLVDVSKGALGKSASSVLGSLIVTKLALASLSRQDTSEDLRIPHLLYVDEAHNFGYGVDYGTILSESRKYRLGACDRNPDPLAASGKHGRGNFRQRRLNWKLPRIPRRRPGPRQAFCSGEGTVSKLGAVTQLVVQPVASGSWGATRGRECPTDGCSNCRRTLAVQLL